MSVTALSTVDISVWQSAIPSLGLSQTSQQAPEVVGVASFSPNASKITRRRQIPAR
jgi:hypothetical protein